MVGYICDRYPFALMHCFVRFQSPLPSGDEGDAEHATGESVPETLIKQEGSSTTEVPVAIAAES